MIIMSVMINFKTIQNGTSKVLKNFVTKPIEAPTYKGILTESFVSSVALSENLINRTNPKQRVALKELYNNFLLLQKNKVTHPASPTIAESSLMHGMKYDKITLNSILENGLVSPDIGKNIRPAYGEQRTIGGVDTWLNDKTRNIKEYFQDWLSTRPNDYPTSPLPTFRSEWRGENKWIDLSGKSGDKIVFVVNPNAHPELNEITKYKVTPETSKLPSTLFGEKMTGDMYTKPHFKRHTFVPVGIPANYFEKIIVGDQLTESQINEIKALIKKHGLDAKVFNTKGETLF